jgi:predicted aspartyl protease
LASIKAGTNPNGTVDVCFTTASKISVGDYHLTNVAVSILPDSTMNPLLGMSALSQLHLEQKNGEMLISK